MFPSSHLPSLREMKYLLILLLLCASGSNAFVYSCKEVEQLVLTKTTINAANACVSLDGYDQTKFGFATDIFVKEGTGQNKWSLAQMVEAGGCVNSSTSSLWSVEWDRESHPFNCNTAFVLLFGSIDTTVVTAWDFGRPYQHSNAGNVTIVSPSGGMFIDFTCTNPQQSINFYSGMGTDLHEEAFYLGSTVHVAACDNTAFTVFALDTAITIETPADGEIKMRLYASQIASFSSDMRNDVIIMGSGKANNIVQHGDNKFIELDSVLPVTFHIDGYVEMDGKVGNRLSMTASCHKKVQCVNEEIPLDSSIRFDLDVDHLFIKYYTNVGNFWRDDDIFFFKIKYARCDLTDGRADFASQLWLDIVFVVDVSQSMTNDNLIQASAMVGSIMASLKLDGTGKYSRVGLVTAATNSETIFNFSTPFNGSIALKHDSSYQADIESGIAAAESMFGLASNRSSRQLIYVISAPADSFTDTVAESFKSRGGVVAVMELGTLSSLANLASPGYHSLGFNNITTDFQTLCDANCFCPSYSAESAFSDNERHTPNQVSKYGSKMPAWIGYELFGIEYYWTDTYHSTYTNWAKGEPNLDKGYCVYSKQTTGFNSAWFAEDCSAKYHFVCERAPCSVKNVCE